MGARFEKRIPLAVKVRVMGTSDGKAFTVDGETIDVTVTGARLKPLAVSLQPGDMVTVQHKMERARYRVAWVGPDGSVGLKLADPSKRIWGKPIARVLGDDFTPEP